MAVFIDAKPNNLIGVIKFHLVGEVNIDLRDPVFFVPKYRT